MRIVTRVTINSIVVCAIVCTIVCAIVCAIVWLVLRAMVSTMVGSAGNTIAISSIVDAIVGIHAMVVHSTVVLSLHRRARDSVVRCSSDARAVVQSLVVDLMLTLGVLFTEALLISTARNVGD